MTIETSSLADYRSQITSLVCEAEELKSKIDETDEEICKIQNDIRSLRISSVLLNQRIQTAHSDMGFYDKEVSILNKEALRLDHLLKKQRLQFEVANTEYVDRTNEDRQKKRVHIQAMKALCERMEEVAQNQKDHFYVSCLKNPVSVKVVQEFGATRKFKPIDNDHVNSWKEGFKMLRTVRARRFLNEDDISLFRKLATKIDPVSCSSRHFLPFSSAQYLPHRSNLFQTTDFSALEKAWKAGSPTCSSESSEGSDEETTVTLYSDYDERMGSKDEDIEDEMGPVPQQTQDVLTQFLDSDDETTLGGTPSDDNEEEENSSDEDPRLRNETQQAQKEILAEDHDATMGDIEEVESEDDMDDIEEVESD